MALLLLIAFITLPIIEIAVLLKVGSGLGVLVTLLLVIATAVLGAILVRQQGLSSLARFRREVDAGHAPAFELIEGLMLLIAGAVLLTPGFVTDAFGFAMLVPAIRRGLAQMMLSRAVVHSSAQATQTSTGSKRRTESVIIEGRYRDAD